MKHVFRSISIALIFVLLFSLLGLVSHGVDGSIGLTDEEKQWLHNNKGRVLTLGIDPYSGMEYFKDKGEEKGYLIPLINIIKRDLELDIRLEASKSWGEVYKGLQSGSIDILFGANETPQRKEFMAFTKPVYKSPYAVIAREDGSIHTIGDIDKKVVGFIQDDVVIELLPIIYKNLKYKEKIYRSQEEGIDALRKGEVDAFITSGGSVAYDYIYRFPELIYASKINTITSDMTLSTRKTDKMLVSILDKEIQHIGKDKLEQIINQGEVDYNIKIINLTPTESDWLKNDGQAVVGITNDYLPFDFYDNGVHKGISGQLIREISRKTGIKLINKVGNFDELQEGLKSGQVDILNIAKTEDRMKYVLYPRPYSNERDIIVGRINSKDARDIYGLEGKSVAVIKGFWHYEHLTKNLTNVKIVDAENIQEALRLVHEGKADYLIENPTVVRYYIEELQLYDLVEKGVTSADSYLYYGITKSKPELASIIDKVIPLIDMGEVFKTGYEEVPHTDNKDYFKKLIIAIIGLCGLLALIIAFVVKLINDLIKKKTEVELLKQREEYLYIDVLTGLHNRQYFERYIKDSIDQAQFPQTVIIGDMNNLKLVNDKYGHHTGDELLKLFADILRECCSEECEILRIGGDEFYIIIESTNEERAEEVISCIRSSACQKSIITENNDEIFVAAAFGYYTRYLPEPSFEETLRIADQRMYHDKKQR